METIDVRDPKWIYFFVHAINREDEDYDMGLLNSLVADRPPFQARQGVPATAQTQVLFAFVIALQLLS
jgi:hypothetical protein